MIRAPSMACLVIMGVFSLESPRDAMAQQWGPLGILVSADSSAVDAHRILADGQGGFFAVWRDERTGTVLNTDVYAQRMRSTGEIAAGWPAGGLAVASLPEFQHEANLTSDGEGGILLAWFDTRNIELISADIYVHRVRGDGTLASGWAVNGVPASTASEFQYESHPVIASDGQGGAYVAWYHYGDARVDLTTDIYLQHLLADGSRAPGWPARGLPVCTAPGDQVPHELLLDDSGGVFVIWEDCRRNCSGPSGTIGDVYGQRIRADGSIEPGWPENGRLLASERGKPSALPDETGGFYLASSTITTSGEDLSYYLQRLSFDALPVGGWPAAGILVCAAPDTRDWLRMASDGKGGVLLAWLDDRPTASNSYEIFATRVRPDGSIAPGWPDNGLLVSDEKGEGLYEILPSIAPDGFGGAYVTWEQGRDFGNPAFLQRLTADGQVSPGWPPYGRRVSESLGQFDPLVVSDGAHGAIVAWDEADTRNRRFGIYANRFGPDGPVATRVSLVESEARADRISLTWHGVGIEGFGAVVERKSGDQPWNAIGAPMSAGPDRVRFEDTAVEAGQSYGYRLAYSESGMPQWTEETWLETSAAVSFALEGLRPNPAKGPASLVFSLPDDAPASLEVIDLRGRRVRSRSVGELGAGQHAIRFEGASGLAPGIYWLRLHRGDDVKVRRGVILK